MLRYVSQWSAKLSSMASYGLSPLCVAEALEKNKASTYARSPTGYRRIEPMMAILSMYVSAAPQR